MVLRAPDPVFMLKSTFDILLNFKLGLNCLEIEIVVRQLAGPILNVSKL